MNRGGSLAAPAVGVLLWLLATAGQAAVCLSDVETRPCKSVDACRAMLQQDALDTSVRLSLCDLYVEQGELGDAAAVLQRGLETCANDRSLCNTFERALSNVEEQRRTAERDRGPEQERRYRDVLRGYCLGRVTTERTASACAELVTRDPDPELRIALAGKLIQLAHPARALAVLRETSGGSAVEARIAALTADAERAREAQVRRCIDQRDLASCDAALLAGATDESDIQQTRGMILTGKGAVEQAFRALSVAFELNEDAETARLITALNAGRLTGNAGEVSWLRSRAFRTLGDTAAEVRELERVIELDTGDRNALERLTAIRPADRPAVVSTSVGPDAATDTDTVPILKDVIDPAPPTRVFSNRLSADGRAH